MSPLRTRANADVREPPLGVYIHWPFCSAICPYCDFNVHGAYKNTASQADWRRAYRAELTHAHGLIPGRKVETVFFGGGTPSLMPADLVAAILADIDALWGLAAQAEISLEANPVSAPRPHLQALRAAGVTRLSLGVQAFDDAALKALGRTHSAAEAQEAFLAAQDIFDTASFDLIYARPLLNPAQDFAAGLAAWQGELSAALALSPPHMSLYQLTIEPDTVFHSRAAQGRCGRRSAGRTGGAAGSAARGARLGGAPGGTLPGSAARRRSKAALLNRTVDPGSPPTRRRRRRWRGRDGGVFLGSFVPARRSEQRSRPRSI